MPFWRFPIAVFFIFQMYLMMLLMGLFYIPLTLLNRDYAFRAVRTYCRYVRWTSSWMLGLRSEVRGTVPTTEVMIASKHQSFFDIIIITSVTPRPKFIMKKELLRAPILGWFALQMGCIPVDRGKRGSAIQKMLADARDGTMPGGQLIIYPQGTRVAPGAEKPYKIGSAALYSELGQPCVPAATNVGVFWPRKGLTRKPGLAVVEFLEPIQPGMEPQTFMDELQEAIEPASDRLMLEAGFDAPAARKAAT